MKKRLSSVIVTGKLARRVARLRGHGGSALPGLVVQRLMPEFLAEMLGSLPDGIILVTGTNGKTTTVKLIADILTASGKRVLTNKTGSNFTRGVAAAVIQASRVRGERLPYDVAVLELDEAYGSQFIKLVRPTYVVALNVTRDQLDRFGEIDTTGKLIGEMMRSATKACILNGDEPTLVKAAQDLPMQVSYFGVNKSLRMLFPTDEELLVLKEHAVPVPKNHPDLKLELTAWSGQDVTYTIDGQKYTKELRIHGKYNFQNAAAALLMVKEVMPTIEPVRLLDYLATVGPAFGRGETIQVEGRRLELVLVKNPAGFRQVLESYTDPALTMIALNDNFADGRDVSWLWDVDFAVLQKEGVAVVSGIRAYDMALRLQYDEVTVTQVQPKLSEGLQEFLCIPSSLPMRIFCTYTAMLAVRTRLSRLTQVEPVL